MGLLWVPFPLCILVKCKGIHCGTSLSECICHNVYINPAHSIKESENEARLLQSISISIVQAHLPRFLSKFWWFLSCLALPTLCLQEVSELQTPLPHSGKLILAPMLVWGRLGFLHICFVVMCSFGREILLWFEPGELRLWCFLSSVPSHCSEANDCTLLSGPCSSSPFFLSLCAKYLSRLFLSREKSPCWLGVGDFCFGQERTMDTLATVGHNGGSTVSDMITTRLWACGFTITK